MDNRMAEIAKLLGVELRETFKIADDIFGEHPRYYRFAENVCLEASNDGVKWKTADAGVLEDILLGDVRIIKLPWKPAIDTEYYVPSITLAKKYDIRKWYNIEDNERHYNLGIVCKTRYEAIKLANKMLAVLKEDRDNG